ncbi:putative wall-associated receptor kinase-like 11 [Raphanus sativus]|uniref:Wall-associated receptor kinase-like 11 n=1 Tax=Raphanus sativus TaxID=3726 RepID=A0A6J0NKB4_RAPSA|nr:putative wall-associated receptor kinase-like 11 [Raphanus sativus]
MRCNNNYSTLFLLSLMLMLLLASNVVTLSSSCQTESCGSIKIPYPFGIQEGCYINEWYKIECRNDTLPFLFKMGLEVVNISLPLETESIYSFISYSPSSYGSIRIKSPITSVGCSRDGKDSDSVLNLTDSPFFFEAGNSLVAVGCNGKASLTNIEPIKVGCELNCTARKERPPSKSIPFFDDDWCSSNPVCTKNKREEERRCDGNGCCEETVEGFQDQRVIGVGIESFDQGNSTLGKCRVAFLTDEVYMLSNATRPESFFSKGYATVRMGWIIQTNNLSYIKSLGCKTAKEYESVSFYKVREVTCICNSIATSGTNYANCGCNQGYRGNPYLLNGCKDINECQVRDPNRNERRMYCRDSDTCVNMPGTFNCVGDKTGAIMIGVGSGFGVLVLVGGIWLLRKFLKKRKITRRKRMFFKRNGGLLLQQQLQTRDGNVEKTRIFTSRELEKATENFSDNRILGQGGQGTVYKGMLVDGRTVAVKKSKVVDEDKLEEFINEVVILTQVNHRHVVKLMGCCLETEVPVLVYEFIPNGNLFQHIHEESDDYSMIWGVRLRIAVDIAGALSYLHSAACSPIYHRDVKSTNILLDEKYRAKVSDFGTSRTVTVDHTHWTTVISGTVGYVDPEYYGSSQYTDKSDVYSFGVILVELITGEKPVITLPDSQEIRGLADHFRAAMKENKFFDIIDARIKDACKPEQVMAVANLARKCLNSKGKKRPYMREVFAQLEKICSSPEDPLVKIETDKDDDEEEEGMNMIEIADSWTTGVTAPAFIIVPSPSSSDVKPLFPRPTW